MICFTFFITLRNRASRRLRPPLLYTWLLGAALAWPVHAEAQAVHFPFLQNFDSVRVPALPAGWSTSQRRSPGINDFVTAAGTPHSSPNAVMATNATIEQSLTSLPFDFSTLVPDCLEFFTRRSGTFLARVVTEASVDTGESFGIPVGDTLLSNGLTEYRLTTIRLPSRLAGEQRVRLRWRIIPDSTGRTGTFRIDDVVVTVRAQRDLAIRGLSVSPPLPDETSILTATAHIINEGFEQATSFALALFEDTDGDSSADPAEFLCRWTNPSALQAGDSATLTGELGTILPFDGLLIGVIEYPDDQSPGNNVAFTPLAIGCVAHSIVINEIMYAPAAPEPEWVELLSTRTDTINLRRWQLSDAAFAARHPIGSGDILLAPKGFVILTRDSAALVDVHPDVNCRIVPVPGFPTLNNGGDGVVLRDQRGLMMDSLMYLPAWGGNAEGRSLERIDPLGESVHDENWRSSRGPSTSTPGRRNTVARRDRDLLLDTLTVFPASPSTGDSIELRAHLMNIGYQDISGITVSFYESVDGDSGSACGKFLGMSLDGRSIRPGKSVDDQWLMRRLAGGKHQYRARADLFGDEDTSNNVARTSVFVPYPPAAMRINEVMYAPPAGMPEWIEVVNTSSDTVDLQDWKIRNRSPSPGYRIASGRMQIAPGGFCVLTKDSTALNQAYGTIPCLCAEIPSLPAYFWTNGGDAVCLDDGRGNVQDSVAYRPAWGGNHWTSLERIDRFRESADSANWGSSEDVSGASPGRANSIEMKDYDLWLAEVRADYGAAGPGGGVIAVVKNKGRRLAGPLSIAVYDDRNRDSSVASDELKVRLQIAQCIAPHDSLVAQIRVPDLDPGIHRLVVEAEDSLDQRTMNNRKMLEYCAPFTGHPIVINEIMFAPLPGDAEYVEIVNCSNAVVDLEGWKMTVGTHEFLLAERGSSVRSGEMFVLASDSALLRRFPGAGALPRGAVAYAGAGSLSLGNTGDVVVIRDAGGALMDSVAFLPSWHNPAIVERTGRSLERIQPKGGSNDSRNWSTCVAPIGGTPGRQNSVYTSSRADRSRLSFSPNPFSPDGDGVEDFVSIHYDLPLQTSLITIKIFDVRGRLIRRLASGEPAGPSGERIWDGLDDERGKARMGIYIILLEAIDERGGVVVSAKGALVLAGRL